MQRISIRALLPATLPPRAIHLAARPGTPQISPRSRVFGPGVRSKNTPMSYAFPTRRATLLGLAALGAAPAAAFAQAYPSRPVRIIIPFGPGGVGDISIRIVADKLGDIFGRRFIIENMPSPDGIVAGRTVIGAAADGYTLLLLTGGTAAALALYEKFPLDVFNALTPISLVGQFDCLMVASAGSEFKSLADFVKAGRAKPGSLSVGSVTTGGVQSLTTNYFKQASGID